ncbi:hypothetical protein [Pseudomonas sp. 'CRE Jenny 4']|uniref:hypothetical protein n=1 Tax=Pseudomonas sp. 'CRE Jenny 4' TaxID=3045817 RepID=UPI003390602B
MKPSNDFSVSWVAPIVPSISLAGIPLGVNAEVLRGVLLKYLVDAASQMYKFENAPSLRLRTHGLDELGNGGYSFSLFDDAVINDLLKGTPALSIMIRGGRFMLLRFTTSAFLESLRKSLSTKVFYQQVSGWVVWFRICCRLHL